jgi:hypothetical protein
VAHVGHRDGQDFYIRASIEFFPRRWWVQIPVLIPFLSGPPAQGDLEPASTSARDLFWVRDPDARWSSAAFQGPLHAPLLFLESLSQGFCSTGTGPAGIIGAAFFLRIIKNTTAATTPITMMPTRTRGTIIELDPDPPWTFKDLSWSTTLLPWASVPTTEYFRVLAPEGSLMLYV